MMRVKGFREERDYEELCRWWKHWGHSIAPADELPDTGFMVFWEDKPILCGFLVLTNAKFALIETLAASPETSWEDREAAIIELVQAAESLAKDLGFRRLLAMPQKERIAEKALTAGFRIDEQKAFLCVKEIR